MKSRINVNYKLLQPKNQRGCVTKEYKKLMKIVAKAIKDDKEVIFDYADNKVTVEIND